MSAWMFLLLAWCAGFVPQTPESSAAAQVACPTCAGTGTAEQPCLRCAGTKRSTCTGCSARARLEQQLGLVETLAKLVPPDKKLEDRAEQLRSGIEQIKSLEKAVAKPQPRGYVTCVACFGAKPPEGAPRCRACSGEGRVPCSLCEGTARRPCADCKYKGTQRRPCDTCNGAKQIARPAVPPSDSACPWSGNEPWRPCVQCDADGNREAVCPFCNGEKDGKCIWCHGTRRSTCMACLGSGSVRSSSPTNKPAKCKDCKGSGKLPCETCSATGKIPCMACKGAGSVRAACERCMGTKKALCNGCSELSARAWELTAEFLAYTGARDDALAYWKVVESRTEKRFASLAEKAANEDARKDVEKARSAELARVRKRIEALKN